MRLSHRDVTAAETDNDFFKGQSEIQESYPKKKEVPINKEQRKFLFKMDPRRIETVEQFLPLNARNMKNNKAVAPEASRSQGQGESDAKSL